MTAIEEMFTENLGNQQQAVEFGEPIQANLAVWDQLRYEHPECCIIVGS